MIIVQKKQGNLNRKKKSKKLYIIPEGKVKILMILCQDIPDLEQFSLETLAKQNLCFFQRVGVACLRKACESS